jgi:predicted TIM-barrel fold metal-dependent hydrolase
VTLPPIWDLHTHLAGAGDTPEAASDRLVACADRLGVGRLVVFMGRPFVADPSPEELRQQNDQVLRCLDRHPGRMIGFCYVNPKHEAASLAEIDRCVRDGPMVGLKLWVAVRCDGPALDPIVARATALGAVVFQHTWLKSGGNLPGESTPMDLAVLAGRHPEAKLICGHTGGRWEVGLRAIRPFANVRTDLGGSDATAGMVEAAVRLLGADRVLYGSDAPGRSMAAQLGKVLGAELPEAAKVAILSGNLRRLLGPALKARGLDG